MSWCPEVVDLWRGLVRGAPEKLRSPDGRTPSGEIFFEGQMPWPAPVMVRAARSEGTARLAPVRRWWRSIFVRQHDSNGGLRIVNVECAASGEELHQLGAVIVVAHIQGDGQAVATWAGADDRKACKPYDIRSE